MNSWQRICFAPGLWWVTYSLTDLRVSDSRYWFLFAGVALLTVALPRPPVKEEKDAD